MAALARPCSLVPERSAEAMLRWPRSAATADRRDRKRSRSRNQLDGGADLSCRQAERFAGRFQNFDEGGVDDVDRRQSAEIDSRLLEGRLVDPHVVPLLTQQPD